MGVAVGPTGIIRGFNLGPDIFIWNSADSMHAEIAKELRKLEPDNPNFQQDPDICFYFYKDNDNIGKFRLGYSGFTGASRSMRVSGDHYVVMLSRLIKMPMMRKLKRIISNADELDHFIPVEKEGRWTTTHYHVPKPNSYEPGGKRFFPHGSRPDIGKEIRSWKYGE